MRGGDLAGVPEDLWERVARSSRRLLLLDYDGTIAPFRVARDEATPLPAALGAIRTLAGGGKTAVAVVSGRPVRELVRLLGPLPIAIVGEHGWETREPDGRETRASLEEEVATALRRAAEAAVARGLGERVERKRTALVLHTRGLAADEAAAFERECATLWEAVLLPDRLRLRRIDGGLELRAAERDKATAVRERIASSPPGTLAVYLGDDETDEDAFREVRRAGFGIRVARDARPSRASGTLVSCEEVVAFLERWIAVVEGTPARRASP